jgi:ribosomal protein S6--L-glutamate ligase
MIESAEGPMVMEVNSSPGLEGIQKATGVDVAEAIIEHIEHELPVAANGQAAPRPKRRGRRRRD